MSVPRRLSRLSIVASKQSACAVIFAATCNWAYGQELVLTPDCPAPTESIEVLVFPGGRVVTLVTPPLAVEILGNTVKITAQISTSSLIPPPATPLRAVIGPFASGTYNLNVVGKELVSSGTFGPEQPIASRQFLVQPDPPACTPSTIKVLDTTFQEAIVSQPFPNSIRAQVLDDKRRPVGGVSVTFGRADFVTDVPSGNPSATFSPVVVTTDAQGNAATAATANGNPGTAEYVAYYFRANELHKAYFILSNRSIANTSVLIPVVEFFHQTLGHYFITSDANEMLDLDTGVHAGWVRTHSVFLAYPSPNVSNPSTSVPVCRFYGLPQAGLDSHFFSADAAECERVRVQWPDAWQLETSAAFFAYLPNQISGACQANAVPVYRVYNNRADANHRYTTSLDIKQQMIRSGWIAEGYGTDAVAICAPR